MSRNISVITAMHPAKTSGNRPTPLDILKVIADFRARPEYLKDGVAEEKKLRISLANVIKAKNENELDAALKALKITVHSASSTPYALHADDVKHFRAEFLKAYIASYQNASSILSGQETWFKDSSSYRSSYQQGNIAGFLINRKLAVEDGQSLTENALLTRADVEQAALIGQDAKTNNAMGEKVLADIQKGVRDLVTEQHLATDARLKTEAVIQIISEQCLDQKFKNTHSVLEATISKIEGLLGVDTLPFDPSILDGISNQIDPIFKSHLKDIKTLGDAKELLVALKGVAHERNEAPSIKILVDHYVPAASSAQEIAHDSRLMAFLATDFSKEKNSQKIKDAIKSICSTTLQGTPNFDTTITAIATPAAIKKFQQAIQLEVAKKQKTAINWMVQQYRDGKLDDAKVNEFVNLKTPIIDASVNKTTDAFALTPIEAMLPSASTSTTIATDFATHKVQFNTNGTALAFQKAMIGAVTQKKQDTDKAIAAILELCRQGKLDLAKLKNFANQTIPDDFKLDASITVATGSPKLTTEMQKQFELFSGTGNKQAATALQGEFKKAFPASTTNSIALPADPRDLLTSPIKKLELGFFDKVIKAWKETKPADQGVAAFLAADFNKIDDKVQILKLINAVDQHAILKTQFKPDPNMTPAQLQETAQRLQDKLKLNLQSKLKSAGNTVVPGGSTYNTSLEERDFIIDELRNRVKIADAKKLERVGKFLNISLDTPEAATAARALLSTDAFGLSSTSDAVAIRAAAYFTGLAAVAKDKQEITLHALQELQRALRPAHDEVLANKVSAKPSATSSKPKPSDQLTLEDAASYLVKNGILKEYLTPDSITDDNWKEFREAALKNIDTFKRDPAADGKTADKELESLCAILEKKDFPKAEEDLELLKKFMEMVRNPKLQSTDDSHAALTSANAPELKKVFAEFETFFKEQEQKSEEAKKTGAPNDAAFKSVTPISETEVKVETHSGKTATITHDKPGTSEESLNLVGSMEGVVDTIVAIYKAEGITKPFSIDVEDLQLTDSKGAPLTGNKLIKVAALLDEQFKAEFNKDATNPLYEEGSAIASAKQQNDTGLGASLNRHGWLGGSGRTVKKSSTDDDHNPSGPKLKK